MSWVNIVHKDTNVTNNNESKKNVKILKDNHTNNFYDNDEKEYLYDMYIRTELENLIYDLRIDCEKHTPWILSQATTSDIYNFLECYINKEESLPVNLSNDNEYINNDQTFYEDEY